MNRLYLYCLPKSILKSHLIKSYKFDVLWGKSIKQKWSLKSVKIMCSYGNKTPTSAQVVMEFILKINEAVITILEKEIVKDI